MTRAPAAAVLLALIVGHAASAVAADAPPPAVREWPAMGTRIRLLVRGTEADADVMATAARGALEEVEAATSAFRPESTLSRVTATAGSGDWIPTGPALDAALDTALRVADASGGAFNPLLAPLLEAHGIDRGLAGAGSPAPALRDLANLQRRPGACRLALPGMALDLGGVAKGVGADWASAAARTAATNDYLLDAGGTLVGRGAWTVGVRDPRGPPDAPPLRIFTLPEGVAAATSGNYERPGHLFDPRTGLPAEGTVLQATALAPTAAEADAWSTALYVLGPDAGRAALSAHPAATALWVLSSPDGPLHLVSSLTPSP
jgi:thiamine biosynthesis lipoprotein